jgi:hypothetical protein
MNQKALVQVRAITVSPVHEPILEVVLIHGSLIAGMEATWDGLQIRITALQSIDGEEIHQCSLVDQVLCLIVNLSNPEAFSQLQGQRLTFWSDQSIPVVDTIQPWQIELSS